MSLTINGVRVFNTSEASLALGVPLSVATIRSLGVEPFARSATATYWSAESLSAIADAMAAKLLAISVSLKGEVNE